MPMNYQKCVNALNGLSSFLPIASYNFGNPSQCVNALNGLSSFLLRFYDDKTTLPIGCQRPKRAFFISTEKDERKFDWLRNCVNALNGLSSFLLMKKPLFFATNAGCVNALNGLSSFLQIRQLLMVTENFVCQRPKRAFFISTIGRKISVKGI